MKFHGFMKFGFDRVFPQLGYHIFPKELYSLMSAVKLKFCETSSFSSTSSSTSSSYPPPLLLLLL
jgi:hypothetical protein